MQHAGGEPQPTIAPSVDGFADRSYIVDSGASLHLVSLSTLSKQEKSTMEYVGNPIPITTATGEVKIHAQVRVYVKELCIFVWAYVLDCDVAVLSLGMLCDEECFTYNWVPDAAPTLT